MPPDVGRQRSRGTPEVGSLGRLASDLFARRYALPILLALHDRGETSTSGMIGLTGGHPAAIIRTLRLLEALGLLSRARKEQGRHPVCAMLTPLGRELIETPLPLWNPAASEKRRTSGRGLVELHH